MSEKTLPALPTLAELTTNDDLTLKGNALMVLLNQPPKDSWLKPHVTAKVKDETGKSVPAKYLPIERVEWLLSSIYPRWWVEIKDCKVIANSVVVTVRLYLINPLTGNEEWQDGIGANPIQTDSGAGACDWNAVKSAGVQMAAPAAETYAVKDAAEKLGKLFGKDANRQTKIDYMNLLKTKPDYNTLVALMDEKMGKLSAEDKTNFTRILNDKEENSYQKMFTKLNAIK